MAVQENPGCFLDTASAFRAEQISSTTFFERTLRHLGPLTTRVHHPADDLPTRQAINPLFFRGPFGPVAVAIKLCEVDPLAESVHADQLIPLFMASISSGTTLETIQSQDAGLDTPVMASSLFRQALILAALQSNNATLATSLIQSNPLAPPPREQCLFTMSHPSLPEVRDIPAGVHAALVNTGWEDASNTMFHIAARCPIAEDGIGLFNVLRNAGLDAWTTNSHYKRTIPAIALAVGVPAVLQYVRDVYSTTDPVIPDMLISAVEARKSGGVEMITWLLDQGLDINYLRVPGPEPRTDPRDQAERDWALRQRPTSEKKTALHAAAYKGNAEAVQFLLERGADPHLVNGIGQKVDAIARGGGHENVVEVWQKWLDAKL